MKKKKSIPSPIDESKRNLEAIKSEYPKLDSLAKSIVNRAKEKFNHGLSLRVTIAEKNVFFLKEIDEVRTNLEVDKMNQFYKIVIEDSEDLIIEKLEDAKLQMRSISEIYSGIDEANIQGIDITQNETEIINQVGEFVKSLAEKEPSMDRELADIFNTKKPIDAVILSVMVYHYEKEYYQYLRGMEIELQSEQPQEPNEGLLKEFTTTRQVLALHFLFDELKLYKLTDKTEIARFAQFLTGKETATVVIGNTNIYKVIKNPFAKSDKELQKNLLFIRKYFLNLGLVNIVNKIDKKLIDINKNLG